MTDPATTIVHASWFTRLRSAFAGIVTGFLLVIGALILMFWNEGRAVDAMRTNKEGLAAVESVAIARVQAANEGRLIHISGPAVADGELRDAALNLRADGLAMIRKVEYFQWQEIRKSERRTKLGGGEETVTTYSYDRQWSDFAQDSSGFHQAAAHRNPAPSLKSHDVRAARGKVGAFVIDAGVIAGITPDQPLVLSSEQAEAAAKAMSRRVLLADGGLYVGDDPANPKVGDMRVRYVIAPQATTLSIIGAQTVGTIQPYPTRSGASILMVRSGTLSADQMFAQAKAANSMTNWVMRGIGFLMMISGLKMILGPLAVLADVIPLVGSIVRAGTGFIATVVGLALGTLTIAVAWFFYRPLLTGLLVAIAVGALYGARWWRSKRAGAASGPVAVPAA